MTRFIICFLLSKYFWIKQRAIYLQHSSSKSQNDLLQSSSTASINQSASVTIIETELSELLRSWLRRFPFWLEGHRKLAHLSFNRDDIATSYASIQAVLALGQVQVQDKILLARCYLRRGLNQDAEKLFAEIHNNNPKRIDVLEDLAATLMAQNKMDQARTLIQSVPKELLSGSGQAAREALSRSVKL